MPITLAHPAAVLPLRRLGLPTAALVIGSMVPDVPLLLGLPYGYATSHSLTGVLTLDLLGSLVLLATWNGVVRDALVDLSPDPVRDRLAARHRLTRAQWLLAPVAAVVGSLTHLAWDSFTHADRWGVVHLAWLRADLGPVPGYKWAQYASGVLGMAVVVAAIVADLRSRTPDQLARRRVLPAAVVPLVAGAVAVTGLGAGLAGIDDGLHTVAFDGVVAGILATVAGIALTSAAWAVAARLREPTSGLSARSRQG